MVIIGSKPSVSKFVCFVFIANLCSQECGRSFFKWSTFLTCQLLHGALCLMFRLFFFFNYCLIIQVGVISVILLSKEGRVLTIQCYHLFIENHKPTDDASLNDKEPML